MKAYRLFAVLAVVCCFAGAAYAADEANVLRGDILYSFPTGQITVSGAQVEADNTFGVDISYERRLTDIVGLQFGAGWADYDINAKGSGIDEKVASVSVIPAYAGILFHPLGRGKTVDWYIGPQFAYMNYGDVDAEEGGKAAVDDDFTWAMRTGVDVMFGDGKIGLNLDIQYYQTSAVNALKYYDSNGDYRTKSIVINPYNLNVGVVFRF